MSMSVADWLWQVMQVRDNLPSLIPHNSLKCLFVIGSPERDSIEGRKETSFPFGRQLSGISDYTWGMGSLRWTTSGDLETRKKGGRASQNPTFGFFLYLRREEELIATRPLLVAEETLGGLRREMPAAVKRKLPWIAADCWYELLAYCCLFQVHPLMTTSDSLVTDDPTPTHSVSDNWVRSQFGCPSLLIKCDHDYRTLVKCALDGLQHLATSRKPPGGNLKSLVPQQARSEGEWSLPMSKKEMRGCLGKMAKDKFETWAKTQSLRSLGRQSFVIRLDTMDAATRKRFER